jgi:hypothetical protein
VKTVRELCGEYSSGGRQSNTRTPIIPNWVDPRLDDSVRPHYVERLGPDDGVFIRVGSTNRKAEPQQIEELKRLNWMSSFDEAGNPKPEVGSD